MKLLGLLVSLVCASVADAAWVRYIQASGEVTCLTALQSRPCPAVPNQILEDIPLPLLTGLTQPGTCELPVEELAPFLQVTNTMPLTLTFVSPIVCFQGQLATTVAGLHALRAAFDRAIVGPRLSPLLVGVYAIQCTGPTPVSGCSALRTRLRQDMPSVEQINEAYIEFDIALQILTGP